MRNLKASTRNNHGGRRAGAGRKLEAGSVRAISAQRQKEALGKRFGWRKSTIGYQRYVEKRLEPQSLAVVDEHNARLPAGSRQRISLKDLVAFAKRYGSYSGCSFEEEEAALVALVEAKMGRKLPATLENVHPEPDERHENTEGLIASRSASRLLTA